MKSSSKNVKQLKGDGLKVRMDLNELNLKISGDGCRVTIARNSGSIRMIGDGCCLKVNCNEGNIEYKGDGGSIYLGGGSKTESVNYVGDGGRIKVKDDKLTNDGNKKCKKSVDKKIHKDVSESELKVKIEKVTSKQDVIENKGNNKSSKEENKDRNLKRNRTIVITKIISVDGIPVNNNNNNNKINNNNKNNNFIKNLYPRSPSCMVIKNLKSGSTSL